MNQQNLDKLITEALAIEVAEAKEAGKLGFMARALVQATLPHSKVYNDEKKEEEANEFERSNGIFRLTILANSKVGIPYGSIPRLLLAWISTEAVKTRQRELILGSTLSEFMAQLDLIPTGGRWGTITRLKEQMKKLFSAAISCTYDDGQNWAIRNVQPVSKAALWWDPKQPEQASLFESTVTLTDEFFNEVINSPVPIHMDILKALKRSPMALDIYCWLPYRLSYLKNSTVIPWAALQMQFGATYATDQQGIRNFKKAFLRELRKVRLFYQDANITEENHGLQLKPSRLHIPQIKLTSSEPIQQTMEKAEIGDKKKYKDARKRYEKYKLNCVIDTITQLEEAERYKLLSSFSDYLSRRNIQGIRVYVKNGEHTQSEKQHLYDFINSREHHLLTSTSIKSFDEFCKDQCE